MPPKIRTLILATFILLFLATAPLIILYGYGYRYDLRYHRFTKTGNLFITSSPANASVLINGQAKKASWYEFLLIYKKLPWVVKLSGRTPVNLTGLLPGRYELVVQKNNYQTWEKQVEIVPEKTTIIQNIKLFLKSPQVELTKTINQVGKFWLAPSKTKIIYQDRNRKTLNFLNLIDNQINSIDTVEDEILKIDWAPNENLIIIKTNEGQKIIDFEAPNVKWPENFLKDFSLVKWSESRPDILYGQKNNLIYQIFLNEKKTSPLFNFTKFNKQIPKTWLIDGRDIYWLINNKNDSILYRFFIDNQQNQFQKIIIKDLNLEFCSSQIKTLICLMGKNSFWLIDSQTKDPKIVFQYPLINLLFWQNNTFIGNNDYEIIKGKILKDLDNNEKVEFEVILRTSQKISKLIYYPTGDWAIFQSEDALFAIELDGEKKNIKTLLKATNILNFWTNQTGSIWIASREDEGLKISKLKIQ